MKPEALDAITTQTMRPSALEAATSRDPEEGIGQKHKDSETTGDVNAPGPATPKQPSTPIVQRIDGTQSAAKVVEDVAHGVRAAVDGAISWAEKKVEALTADADTTGPYGSAATSVPSDLDPIASGLPLPAVTTQKEKELDEHEQKESNEKKDGQSDRKNEKSDSKGPP